jgi:hypothetical protein
MSRARDSQRQRLYDAECEAERQAMARGLLVPLPGGIVAARELVDRITASRWWKANAPQPRQGIEVMVGRAGTSGAWADPWRRTIMLGPGERRHGASAVGSRADVERWPSVTPAPLASVPIILHELAHMGIPRALAPHGREFARLQLRLLARWVSPEVAAIFRERYAERRVRWRAAPAAGSRVGNPEALAAFRRVSDGDWVVAATLLPPPPRDEPGHVGRWSYGCSISSTDQPRIVFARRVDKDSGLIEATGWRKRARVWRTRATAERWAELIVQTDGGSRAITDIRVEPLETDPRDG